MLRELKEGEQKMHATNWKSNINKVQIFKYMENVLIDEEKCGTEI